MNKVNVCKMYLEVIFRLFITLPIMRKNDLRTSEVFVVAPFLPQGENLLWQNSMIKKII